MTTALLFPYQQLQYTSCFTTLVQGIFASPCQHLQHVLCCYHKYNNIVSMPASSIYIYFTQVYYRLHVSVFKLLMRQPQDAPYDVILAYLKEAAEGPFATGGERKRYVLFC